MGYRLSLLRLEGFLVTEQPKIWFISICAACAKTSAMSRVKVQTPKSGNGIPVTSLPTKSDPGRADVASNMLDDAEGHPDQIVGLRRAVIEYPSAGYRPPSIISELEDGCADSNSS